MKRTLLITGGFAFIILLSLAFTAEKPDPGYKNLQVLPKDITKPQMDSVMRHFNSSLNVKCGFCHVRNESTNEWDHASDKNKHKLIAREMMVMTNKINDEYFNYTGETRTISTQLMVTCYTCHNGAKAPAVKALPKQLLPPGMSSHDSTRRN